MEILNSLKEKTSDKSWTDAQDAEFIKLLESLSNIVENMGYRLFMMAELIDNFYDSIIQLFTEQEDTATSSPENGDVYPEPNTNFSPEPAE